MVRTAATAPPVRHRVVQRGRVGCNFLRLLLRFFFSFSFSFLYVYLCLVAVSQLCRGGDARSPIFSYFLGLPIINPLNFRFADDDKRGVCVRIYAVPLPFQICVLF